jgi:hypothetical protein
VIGDVVVLRVYRSDALILMMIFWICIEQTMNKGKKTSNTKRIKNSTEDV